MSSGLSQADRGANGAIMEDTTGACRGQGLWALSQLRSLKGKQEKTRRDNSEIYWVPGGAVSLLIKRQLGAASFLRVARTDIGREVCDYA